MLVTITKQDLNNVTVSSDTNHVSILHNTATITIESGLGPRGPKGDPGSLTTQDVENLLEGSPLLDGEVNGLTPLSFYNLAKGT